MWSSSCFDWGGPVLLLRRRIMRLPRFVHWRFAAAAVCGVQLHEIHGWFCQRYMLSLKNKPCMGGNIRHQSWVKKRLHEMQRCPKLPMRNSKMNQLGSRSFFFWKTYRSIGQNPWQKSGCNVSHFHEPSSQTKIVQTPHGSTYRLSVGKNFCLNTVWI